MSSISPQDLEAIKKCIVRVAKGRAVVAACLYGSRVAGYARPDSDVDVLVVLEDYPYMVKYVYFRESGMKVSALVVDRTALERDAKSAFLGEFVVGRLIHIYYPITNAEFFAARQDGLLQISDKHIFVERDKTRLKLTKRLQEFSSYLVHTYAGRKIMYLAVMEAESKISRKGKSVQLPDFMACPRRAYWKLPEGRLIVDGKNWLDDLGYSVTRKRRLGNVNSRTMLYVLNNERKIVVKELARKKALKWAGLGLWTAPVKRFRIDPLLRLGSEYKAIRYIRSLGLRTPAIDAVVLDRKLLVTQFIGGETLAGVIRDCIRGRGDASLLREVGAQIAKIHGTGSCLGNIKPKNVIVSGGNLCFTDVEQFVFQAGDPVWDLAQFISWGLKGISNSDMAAEITREFLKGYIDVVGSGNIDRLAKSRRYIESFYPVLSPSVARVIKKEIREIAK